MRAYCRRTTQRYAAHNLDFSTPSQKSTVFDGRDAVLATRNQKLTNSIDAVDDLDAQRITKFVELQENEEQSLERCQEIKS